MSRTFLGPQVPIPKLYLEAAKKEQLRKKAKITTKGTENKNKENGNGDPTSKQKEEQKDKLEVEDNGKADFDDNISNIYMHSFTFPVKRKAPVTPNDCGKQKKVCIFEPKDTLAETRAKDSKDKTPKKMVEIDVKDIILFKKPEASPQAKPSTSINPIPAPLQEAQPTPASNSKPTRKKNTKNDTGSKTPKADDAMVLEITTKKDNKETNPAPAPEAEETEKKGKKKGSKAASKSKKDKEKAKDKGEPKVAIKKTKNKKEVYDLNKPSKFGTSKRLFTKAATENYVKYNPKNPFKDRFRGDKKVLMTKYRANGKFKFSKKFYQKNKELIQNGGEFEEQDLTEADIKANVGLTDKEIREKILISRIQGSKFLSRGLAECLETQTYPEVELEKDPLEMDESDHLKMLKEHFGHTNFKPCQLESIQRVLRGLSTFVILNTGSGKSLIYQYSSLLMKNLTIVVSPLISLVVDQLQKLPKSIRGASLNGSLTAEEKKKVLSLVHEGKVKILFLSPEYVSYETFDNFPAINFVCVDEVHCMSEWSHNFRTSYFFLKSNLKKKLGEPAFLGLTATATKDTQASICSLLGLTKDCVIWNTTQNKDLVLSISRDRDVFKGLINLLRSPKFSTLTSIIVYCNMKRTVESMAQFLNSNGIKAAAYHADKSDTQRIKIQEDFMKNKYRVIVATIAFGMGIDKQDVQAVIHVSLPHTLENYVQEIGRAGRNGNTAYCHLFLSDDDYFKTRNMLYGEFVEENVIKLLVTKLLAQRQVQGENEEAPVKNPLFSIKVSELLEQFDLKLETITTIIARIGQCDNNFFKLIGISKLKCIVGFYKNDPEVLKTKSMFVFNLVEIAKKFRGNYTVNLCQLANKMDSGIEDCLNELRALVKAGEISYQLEDEGFIYQLNYIPKPEELHEIIGGIYQKIRAIENMSVLKIDTIYYIMRILAYPSVDFMVKNKDLESKKNVDIKIKDQEEMFELEIEAKNDSDFMVQGSFKVQKLVGIYFQAEDIAAIEDDLGEEQKKNEVLPLYFIPEEDRGTIINEVIRFIRGQPDIYFSSDNGQRDINSLSSKKVLKILQGVNSKHTPISEWKNSPFWGKYNQYDSQGLDACIKDAVLIHLLDKSKIEDEKEAPAVEKKEGEIEENKKENSGEMETENVGNATEENELA